MQCLFSSLSLCPQFPSTVNTGEQIWRTCGTNDMIAQHPSVKLLRIGNHWCTRTLRYPLDRESFALPALSCPYTATEIAACIPDTKLTVLDGEIVCLDRKGRPQFRG